MEQHQQQMILITQQQQLLREQQQHFYQLQQQCVAQFPPVEGPAREVAARSASVASAPTSSVPSPVRLLCQLASEGVTGILAEAALSFMQHVELVLQPSSVDAREEMVEPQSLGEASALQLEDTAVQSGAADSAHVSPAISGRSGSPSTLCRQCRRAHVDEQALDEQLYAARQEELLQTVRHRYRDGVHAAVENIPASCPGQLPDI